MIHPPAAPVKGIAIEVAHWYPFAVHSPVQKKDLEILNLVPLAIADLRDVPSEPLDELRAAKMRGAGLFLISSSQVQDVTATGSLEGDFLLQWSPTLSAEDLDPSIARFLVETSDFGEFARWARGRLGNMDAVVRVSPDDEGDLDCCLLPHLEAIPGMQAVLCPVATSLEDLLLQSRRLLAANDPPLALLPFEGDLDRDGLVVVLSTLIESGRIHSFALPDREPRLSAASATSLLNALELRRFGLNYVSCPTCGRCEIPLEGLVSEVRERTAHISTPLNVAIMGCVVNGPGESKHADIGIAGGRSGGVLIKDGEVVGKIEKHQFADVLVEQIEKMAAHRGEAGGEDGLD